uniref:RNase H type-1 domain-containing protein n=1 Tax=Chenopodium quinoa TaxID=63459 RepID=A0A803M6Z1_CHEQI
MNNNQVMEEVESIEVDFITSTEWDDDISSPPDPTKAVSFGKETLIKLRQPWKLTLMGKCLGISVRPSFITQRVRAMWRPKGSLEVIDLVEYYDKEALFDIAKLAGNPLRVDYATDHLTRARYARVCIDIDLTLPLVTNVWDSLHNSASSSTLATRKWGPPQKGYHKLNTYGSWISVDNAGGGGVIRCEKGLWVTGYAMRFNALSADAAELMAIREGLLTAWGKGIKFLELETDADALTRMLKDPKSFEDGDLGNLIRDVASLLERQWTVQVFHISRSINEVADKLAFMGRNKFKAGETVPFTYPPAECFGTYAAENLRSQTWQPNFSAVRITSVADFVVFCCLKTTSSYCRPLQFFNHLSHNLVYQTYLSVCKLNYPSLVLYDLYSTWSYFDMMDHFIIICMI